MLVRGQLFKSKQDSMVLAFYSNTFAKPNSALFSHSERYTASEDSSFQPLCAFMGYFWSNKFVPVQIARDHTVCAI